GISAVGAPMATNFSQGGSQNSTLRQVGGSRRAAAVADELEDLKSAATRQAGIRGRRTRAGGLSCHARYFVAKVRDAGAELLERKQSEGRGRDRPRQQRFPRAQRDGADLDDQLVEESGVMELPDEFSASHQPDVLPASSRLHLFVHRADVALHKADIGGGD